MSLTVTRVKKFIVLITLETLTVKTAHSVDTLAILTKVSMQRTFVHVCMDTFCFNLLERFYVTLVK